MTSIILLIVLGFVIQIYLTVGLLFMVDSLSKDNGTEFTKMLKLGFIWPIFLKR